MLKEKIKSIPVLGKKLSDIHGIAYAKVKKFEAERFNRNIEQIQKYIGNDIKVEISKKGFPHIIHNGIKYRWNPTKQGNLLMLSKASWEEKCMEIMKNNVHEGSIVFDIGANFGIYSCNASKLVGKTGQVHSFEPSKIFETLEYHINLNALKNVVLNNYALSDFVGTVQMYLPSSQKEDLTEIASFCDHGADWNIYNVETFSTKVNTLDLYIKENNITRIDFLKIDTEGAENLVIEGGIESIQRFKPIIILEIQDAHTKHFGYTPETLIQKIERIGYSVSEIDGLGNYKAIPK